MYLFARAAEVNIFRDGGAYCRELRVQVKMFTSAARGKKIHFLTATKEDFISQLKGADAVYFNGGSTNKLLTRCGHIQI